MAVDPALIASVRLLIADPTGPKQLLSDEEITTALDRTGGSDLRAAARCLEAIAVSEVLVGKKIRTQDLSTDGPAVSAELRALAARYRAEADDADPEAGRFDGFDLAPVTRAGRRPEHTNPQVWGL